ncbi:DUF3530 family protein [Pokkaliibacter sp. MBI-7]|uniref:DUF3530 family protein n=1 Tax=Pokkaliibacter sp. MBI-7 TaxID=3040600 RepID=UPI00244C1124|nr:DUF3530 family protein [Pokkaliibacter sp. MBI-7]MDH2431840.1 DUF3530 family protein [Pokkaliibacter sp. MBI-7]
METGLRAKRHARNTTPAMPPGAWLNRASLYVKSLGGAGAILLCLVLGSALVRAESAGTPASDPASTTPPATDANGQSGGSAPAADQAPAQRVMLDPVTEQIAALAKQEHPPTQVLTLGEAPDQYLGLFVAHNTALLSGGIIVVPDDGTHPDWPGPIHALRLRLPDYGWDSLSIAIPPVPDMVIPERTMPVLSTVDELKKQAEQGQAGQATPAESKPTEPPAAATPLPEQAAPAAPAAPAATEEKPKPNYVEVINQRIQKAEDYLRAQGAEKIVVVGIGTGAAQAARYLAGKGDNQSTLVMIDVRDPGDTDKIDIMATLAGLDAPVLDLYHGDRNNLQAKMRRDNARRYGKLAFEQIRLQPRPGNPAEDWAFLVQRVRGWLKTRQQEQPVDPRPKQAS